MAVAGDGDWTPPNGSILVKNFRLGTTLVETRLFMHHSDGSWAGYSYQWNDAQTDATLVSGGATKVWGAQTWIYRAKPAACSAIPQLRGARLASKRRR